MHRLRHANGAEYGKALSRSGFYNVLLSPPPCLSRVVLMLSEQFELVGHPHSERPLPVSLSHCHLFDIFFVCVFGAKMTQVSRDPLSN